MASGVEAELLEAVYAAPADDAPRVVYADWLQARADPRGEFIALQLERAHNRARRGGRKRENELLEEHGVRWRKPLRAWDEPHTSFERGFMIRAGVNAINDHPAWALVRECNMPPTKPHTPATNLVKVTGCDNDSLVAMSKLAEPLAIEDFGCFGPSSDDTRLIAAFERIRCLPKLRRLELARDQDSLDWVFRAPCTADLEELVFSGVVRQLARWRDALTPTPLARFIVGDRSANWRMGSRVGLERDHSGALSRLIVLAPATASLSDEIHRAIESLPRGSLTAAQVHVDTAVWKASTQARARLERLLERQGVVATFEKIRR
jgi:uncharacterized protein (TIGR02996 family)